MHYRVLLGLLLCLPGVLWASQCSLLIVGDSLVSDVGLGRRAGMATALVMTGVTHPETLAHSEVRPDFVLDNLGDLPALIEARQ